MIILKIQTLEATTIEFKADVEILQGLYLTYLPENVSHNCANFQIESIESTTEKITTRIKTLQKVSIVTIQINSGAQFQYFVGNDLGLEALVKLSEETIPNNIKEVILKAFHLIQKSSLIPKIRLN